MSKRIIKNITMIILIVLLCIAMFFTLNYRKKNFGNRNREGISEIPNFENGERPNNNSKQKYIALNLGENIEKGNEILLKDLDGNLIESFMANEDFKTLIISNNKLQVGEYNLYKENELITKVECK